MVYTVTMWEAMTMTKNKLVVFIRSLLLMLFVIVRVPWFAHVACAYSIFNQPSPSSPSVYCTRVACVSVKWQEDSEFESEFELVLLILQSPHAPRPLNSTQDTPPILYTPFGLMPEQHVAVGAQTVTPDIVRVGGRYRVGQLLGAGTFGASTRRPSGPSYLPHSV
jgi:hypothetical protein